MVLIVFTATRWHCRYIRSKIGEPVEKLIGSHAVAKTIAKPNKISVVVIDEWSMLDGKKLTALDERLRRYNAYDRPFGGIPIIMVGDPLQLPTVSNDSSLVTKSFQTLNAKWHLLIDQNRFDPVVDAEYMDLLAEVRTKILERRPLSASANSYIDYRLSTDGACRTVPTNALVLCPTHAGTSKHNWRGTLARAAEYPDSKRYILTGNPDSLKTAVVDIRELDAVPLVEGAPVLITRNIYAASGHSLDACNGQRGRFVKVGGDAVIADTVEVAGIVFEIVKIDKALTVFVETDGSIVEIAAKQSRPAVNPKSKAAYELPILPAYAVTVHKMQGQTIRDVKLHIDFTADNAKEMLRTQPQLLYVALSRPTTSSAVTLAGISSYSLRHLVETMPPQTEADRRLLELACRLV